MPPKRKKGHRRPASLALPAPLSVDALPEWEEIPGHEVLLRWMADLREALRQKNADAWTLAGRMAMVVTSSSSWGSQALRKVGAEMGMPVHLIAASDLIALPLIGEWHERKPSMLLIEPGDWMLMDAVEDTESESYLQSVAVAEWIARSLAEAPPACGVVIGCVAAEVPESPVALRRAGVLDRYLELPSETLESQGRRLIMELGSNLLGASISNHPARFAREFLTEYEDVRRRAMAVLMMRRHRARTGLPFEFADLVRLSLQGYAEATGNRINHDFDRKSTAYHEAGHAVVAIIDSGGANTPEIASIVPTRRYQGVVRESADYYLSKGEGETYRGFRHRIRILLAGRAAEELAMGAEFVTNGCESDLDVASGKTLAAFSSWGFLPDMDVASNTGSNLLVHLSEDDDRMHDAEVAHLMSLGRTFLDKEYQYVMSLLKKNRSLLDRVAHALLEHLTLDQEMLIRMTGEPV